MVFAVIFSVYRESNIITIHKLFATHRLLVLKAKILNIMSLNIKPGAITFYRHPIKSLLQFYNVAGLKASKRLAFPSFDHLVCKLNRSLRRDNDVMLQKRVGCSAWYNNSILAISGVTPHWTRMVLGYSGRCWHFLGLKN